MQIPAEPLNDLMRFTAGMGATGETYLVGPDGLMRSQSRFTDARTLLETKVNNQAVQDGKTGKSGARVVADYRAYQSCPSTLPSISAASLTCC